MVKNARKSCVDKTGSKTVGGPRTLATTVKSGHDGWAKRNQSPRPSFGTMCERQAVQIMTGLFVHTLGLLWTYLLVSQILAFQKVYLPFAILSGFPFWAAAFFLLSGIFTVLFERRRSRSLMTCSIVLNILSACSAVIGLLLLCLEFLAYALAKKSIWPHRAGKILSNYLFLFTLLELCVTSTLINWLYKAKHSR
uniref:Uncharacterized protein n=1 Tax=Capra hircus TaxID=9925 RepID=A0A452FTQ3_CAPHI